MWENWYLLEGLFTVHEVMDMKNMKNKFIFYPRTTSHYISLDHKKNCLSQRPISFNVSTEYISYMCCLYHNESESSEHMFLKYSFTTSICNWSHSIIKYTINLSTFLSTFKVYNRDRSPQCKLVITSALINIFNVIWQCRNNFRFSRITPNMSTSLAMSTSKVSLV